jgi:hypothetical protein
MNVEGGVAFARLKRLPLRLRLAHLAALLRSGRMIVHEGSLSYSLPHLGARSWLTSDPPASLPEGSITSAGGRRKGHCG